MYSNPVLKASHQVYSLYLLALFLKSDLIKYASLLGISFSPIFCV